MPSGNGELDISLGPAAAPEPSTWAMLLLGFAGLGASPIGATEAPADPRKRSFNNGLELFVAAASEY